MLALPYEGLRYGSTMRRAYGTAPGICPLPLLQPNIRREIKRVLQVRRSRGRGSYNNAASRRDGYRPHGNNQLRDSPQRTARTANAGAFATLGISIHAIVSTQYSTHVAPPVFGL